MCFYTHAWWEIAVDNLHAWSSKQFSLKCLAYHTDVANSQAKKPMCLTQQLHSNCNVTTEPVWFIHV